jgi:hypothetical protein
VDEPNDSTLQDRSGHLAEAATLPEPGCCPA